MKAAFGIHVHLHPFDVPGQSQGAARGEDGNAHGLGKVGDFLSSASVRSHQSGNSLTLNERMAAAGREVDGWENNDQSTSSFQDTWATQVWSSSVLKLTLSVPETGAGGVIFIDPGGAYGARQLDFGQGDAMDGEAIRLYL